VPIASPPQKARDEERPDMSTRITTRLPQPLERLVTTEATRHGCDAGQVVRAALSRLTDSPLTPDEITASELPRGNAAFGVRERRKRAKVARAGKVPRT